MALDVFLMAVSKIVLVKEHFSILYESCSWRSCLSSRVSYGKDRITKIEGIKI